MSVLANQLRESFSSDDLRVETAANASMALEFIADNPPSLIILDANLSDSSGLEMHQRIKRLVPCVPVIFIVDASCAETVIGGHP